jgi:hypothetical protein
MQGARRGRRGSHGFFSQNVLACLKPADRVLGVHTVGKNDVDDVDFRVVFDRIVILVVVDVPWVDPVPRSQFVRLVKMATHKRHYLGLFAFRKGRKNLIDGEIAQPDDGPSELLPGWLRNHQRSLRHCLFQKRSGDVGYGQTLAHLADESSAHDSLCR